MGAYQPCAVSNLPESRFPNLRNGGFQNAGLAVSWGRNIQNTKKPTFALKKEYVKKSAVYVHVRAYKTVGGKKICGGWSKGVKVKVK